MQLKHAGRSVMVELNPAFEDGGEVVDQKPRTVTEEMPPATADMAASPVSADVARPVEQYSSPAPAVTESAADGVRFVSEVLQKATTASWPMYIRNVKQLIRAADSGFDERRYGFGGLMDLLRACQRDGVMRLERDRRGGLRVFPGAALQRPAGVHVQQPQESSQQGESSMDAEVDEGAGQPLIPMETEPSEASDPTGTSSTQPPNCSAARNPGSRARRRRLPPVRARPRDRARRPDRASPRRGAPPARRGPNRATTSS